MKRILFYLLFTVAFLQATAQQIDKLIPKILSHKILPMAGYNMYDGFQLGIAVHNISIPQKKFTYYAAPAYGFNSKRATGYAGLSYRFEGEAVQPVFKYMELGVDGGSFSTDKGLDSTGKKIFTDIYRVVPRMRLTFNSASDEYIYFDVRAYVIGEKNFDYVLSELDSMYHPTVGKLKESAIVDWTFGFEKSRKLFPYDFKLQFQDAKSFYRINANMNYFFNYLNKGGVQMRLFAAKFGYWGGRTETKNFETQRYQPKLTAVTGYEDYTYSNYFIGRNETDGFASQQIMMRDGGMKLRTDLFQDLQGRSDNWVASMNLNTTLPGKIFPENFPLKIFLDIGTYSDLWKRDSPDARFLYVAGLQLSFLKNLINIYAPVLYSKKFKDSFSSVPEENKFLKKISFSIDIQRFNLRRYEQRN